jgi:enterochelin esterase-like enzyme
VIARRTILVGGGAIALGGGAAGLIESSDRVKHAIGLSGSPDHRVPSAHIPRRSGTLRSRHMKRGLGWTLSVPAGSILGVVFCLHGRNSTNRFAFDTIHLDDVAASLRLPIAFASVDGGADSYWHARADGTDAMSMLLDEFVPMVDRMLGPHRRALLGWSMGGYGALLGAERAPIRFRAVAATSPALWRSAAATAPGAFDSPADYHRNDVFASVARLARTTVRIDCGTGDPFYSADRYLASVLPQPHVASFGRGYHNASYWRSVAPAQIRTIASVLSP